jgi:D-alanyl-D-alanine carboxypeptidase/D-alanyl-D-alanine-endopeptidase (penicillin-binding protein 4)
VGRGPRCVPRRPSRAASRNGVTLLLRALALAAALAVPGTGGLPWTPAGTTALGADLDHLLAAKTLHAAHVGVLVAAASDGQTLYERDADSNVQPASTMKLLVGSIALDRLGPAYRFATTLAHAPLPSGDGESLVLHGGGDPLLRRADLDAAADAVRAAGITRAMNRTQRRTNAAHRAGRSTTFCKTTRRS